MPYAATFFIGISIVETFLVVPSWDSNDSEPILISPTINAGLVLFNTICTTSTAWAMDSPLALMVTKGNVDS